MAIYASVSHRKLHVQAATRSLTLTVESQEFFAQIKETSLYVSPEWRSLAAGINYQQLNAQVQWKNLFLFDVHVNPEKTLYLLSDSFGFVDSAAITPRPFYTDSFQFSDSSYLSVSKSRSDEFSFFDSAVSSVVVAKSDALSMSESSYFSTSIAKSETLSISDSVATLVDYGKLISDSTTLSDSAAMTVASVASETVSLSDSAYSRVDLGRSDSFSFVEDVDFSSVKAVNDTTDTLGGSRVDLEEVISFVRSPYNFNYTWDGTSLDVSGSLPGDVSITDSLSGTVSKALTDAFTLDDFAQIDKDVFGVKSNIYSLADSQAIALSKVLADSIITMDSPALHTSRVDTDSFTFDDVIVLSPRKVVNDSFSVTEVLLSELTVASGRLNSSELGLTLLNAD